MRISLRSTLHAVDPQAPTIASAAVVNGKLVVTGEGFRRGAEIVVGTRQFKNTKRDKQHRTTMLSSKTADGALAPNVPTAVSVINPDGHQSPANRGRSVLLVPPDRERQIPAAIPAIIADPPWSPALPSSQEHS